MSKEQLRADYERLTHCKTIENCIEMIDVYTDFLLRAVLKHHGKEFVTQAESDAQITLQMMMTKIMNIKILLGGVSFNAKNGNRLNNIIDPMVIAGQIRTMYETTSFFNLMFRCNRPGDERRIIYLLWQHASIITRQSYKVEAQSPMNKGKLEAEKEILENIVKEIKSNKLFQSLDQHNQESLMGDGTKNKKGCIGRKEYKIKFDGKRVLVLDWQSLAETMGVNWKDSKDENGNPLKDKNGEVVGRRVLDNIYSFLSSYSHPSYISMVQFQDLFPTGADRFSILARLNIRYAFLLMSIFIADYLNLFPNVRTTFESMSLAEQIAIDSFNRIYRGEGYIITEFYKELD